MPPEPPIRFAPSTTGPAHPGTLLSGLLCWLDARSRGARFIVRLENLDPDRCKPEFEDAMLDALRWFGLDGDETVRQHTHRARHEDVLDQLAARGLLYPCACSRSRLKALGRIAPDGGYAYDNQCRDTPLPPGGWRACDGPVRLALPPDTIDLIDEGGLPIRQTPSLDMGDPVVIRRDGAIAYHLASVADDTRAGIRRLIRGHDLLPSAPVQILLHRLLGYPEPTYRHHFLFLERRGEKLAKFHGAVGVPVLRQSYSGPELCGLIAHAAGLLEHLEPITPAQLLPTFAWQKVRSTDITLHLERWTLKVES